MSINGPNFVGVAAAADPVNKAGTQLNRRSGKAGTSSGQKRTFALLDRINGAVQGFQHPDGFDQVDTDPTTLDTGTTADTRSFFWNEHFKTDNTRLQVYEDAKEMDETSDEVAAALDTLADSATNPEDGSQHTFVIEIDEGAYRDQAEAIFDQVTDSLDLQEQAFSIAREFLMNGDAFLELVVDEQNRLARGKILPVGTMYRNEDQSGNLMMGEPLYDQFGNCVNKMGDCAFDQRENMTGKVLAGFYNWQIVHFRWNHRGNDRYGRSMLKTARLAWKKLRACEEAMVVARLQRAWMRFVHYVDTTGMSREEARAALKAYRQDLMRKLVLDQELRENPFEVASDFFISSGYIRDIGGTKFIERRSDIKVLPGDNMPAQEPFDIEYLQNKLFASLRVPKAYLGFERDVNAKATLTTQDIQYARVLRRVQNVLSIGYKTIFDLALLLADINPTDVSYSVRWPTILVSDEERDAIIRRMNAEADAVYWQMGAPSTRYIVQERYGWDDEAWEIDLVNAQMDPPSRVKLQQRGLPADNQMQDTGLDNIDDAAQVAADQLSSGSGTASTAPGDNFDQTKVASGTVDAAQNAQNAQRKTTTQPRGRKNATRNDPASGAGEEGGREETLSGDLALDGVDLDEQDDEMLPAVSIANPAELLARPRIIIPGAGARRRAQRRDFLPYGRERSVAGVHAQHARARGNLQTSGAGLSDATRGAAQLRIATQHELERFYVDLLGRKTRGGASESGFARTRDEVGAAR